MAAMGRRGPLLQLQGGQNKWPLSNCRGPLLFAARVFSFCLGATPQTDADIMHRQRRRSVCLRRWSPRVDWPASAPLYDEQGCSPTEGSPHTPPPSRCGVSICRRPGFGLSLALAFPSSIAGSCSLCMIRDWLSIPAPQSDSCRHPALLLLLLLVSLAHLLLAAFFSSIIALHRALTPLLGLLFRWTTTRSPCLRIRATRSAVPSIDTRFLALRTSQICIPNARSIKVRQDIR